MDLCKPEITPTDIALLNSPSALPMAIAVCPIFILELDNFRKEWFDPSIFKMARSCNGSRASTLASFLFPSLETTKPEPAETSLRSVPSLRSRGTRNPSPKKSRKNGSSAKNRSTTGTSLEAIILTTAGEADSTTLTTSSSWRTTASEVCVSMMPSRILGRLNTKGFEESSLTPPNTPILSTDPITDTIKLKTTVNTTICLVVG